MALSRVTTWASNDILTASALNGEFNNILNNAVSLISPLTANVSAGNFQITDLTAEAVTSAFSSGNTGRVGYRTDLARLQTYTGSVNQIVAMANDAAMNFTFNSDFELWGLGTALAPSGWTLAASAGSPTIAKDTTAGQFKTGTASATVTASASAETQLYQDVDLISGFGPATWWGSKTVTVGGWVRATSASKARLFIDDGAATTYSSYHTGGSSLEFLTVTATLQTTPTRVRVGGAIVSGGATAQFDSIVFVSGPAVTDWFPSSWRGRNCTMHFSLGAGSLAGGSTGYQGNGTMAAAEGGATSNTSQLVPYKAVARNFVVGSSAAPGAAKTYVATLRRAAGMTASKADTAINATISGASSQDASDTTNQVNVAVGDALGVSWVTSAAAATLYSNATITLEEMP